MVVIDRFLEMLAAEKGATRSTLSAYETDLKNFFKFLKGKDIYSVVSTDIKDYLITQKHLAATSLARRISSLRQFYKFLMSEGEIVENPTSLIEAPRYRRKLPSILSETDINHLLEGAKSWNGPEGLRLFALLEILYASGLRVSELVSLSFISAVEALKNKKPFLLIRGKGNKDRLVPLTPTAVDALHKYLTVRHLFLSKKKESLWLFPSSSQEGYLTRQRFGQLLKELALRAGLNPQHLSPHIVRHAFATHLLHHGADLIIVQKLMGHSDISTTQIYTHIAQDDLTDMIHTFHPLAKRSLP